MVKGVNDNLDNVVSYKDLPITVITSIIPFENILIYDGILTQFGIEMGNAFEEMITKDLESSIKYYHL